MARRELTDAECELIGPFLPIGRYGPYPEHLREQFEGVIWKFRSGAQWREMPPEFGVWQTVYDRFLRWRDAGVFQVLMEGTKAAGRRRTGHVRPGSGRTEAHPAATPGPPEGGPAGPFAWRLDHQGPSRCRSALPPALLPAD
ncbi:hypothetical protein GCM10017668_69440 [Streptomyces tuirus]|uniref:Insertion element IS402-like domain-containing protein n=1 Tax=Streptomyces tuirus TaxID=68278 RepID=A0A7G1NRJ7_9ACTN|nr:hypothetical protein GCM10017668_69440 [Streptomyces tuirus]